MERLGALFGNRHLYPKDRRQTERGDLFDTILSHLNPARVKDGYRPITHPRLGRMLEAIPTKDLYALISKCDDAERRGYAWGAIFNKEITPNESRSRT